MSMALSPFLLASAIGRGMRFFLVAGLMAWGGEKMEAALHKLWIVLGGPPLASLAQESWRISKWFSLTKRSLNALKAKW